uniref:Uncharacterized protein n=1 Tax=Cacopsylla melanoneura TaxID=428564 RepID=A0A8D8THX6_9HEMI
MGSYTGGFHLSSAIFILQKRAIRTIFGMRRDESCSTHTSIFKDNKILTLWGQLALDTCVLTHKNQNSINRHSNDHHYDTRAKDNLVTSREIMFQKSYLNTGIKLFNNLPSSLKQINNINKFKEKLKRRIINISPYSLQDL